MAHVKIIKFLERHQSYKSKKKIVAVAGVTVLEPPASGVTERYLGLITLVFCGFRWLRTATNCCGLLYKRTQTVPNPAYSFFSVHAIANLSAEKQDNFLNH